ncbi:NACHT, LRR and PYD domains-containing protein 3-like isoform X2 [Brachyhypopomus gauderio]|uniref:NACHT, LRR and PYD domains-containing protein 3-like isoform X2 n=1 Tax=Brachyhypopomus gauderio TaxID=698409 RepID=UPI00404250C4
MDMKEMEMVNGPVSPASSLIQDSRPVSPVVSVVSFRSDRSMQQPINLKDEDSTCDQSLLQDSRPVSPVVSFVSFKSDRSMQQPINLKDDDSTCDQSLFQDSRPVSPVASVVSLKSDRSMQQPINLKDDDSTCDQRKIQKNMLTSGPKQPMKNDSIEARYGSKVLETYGKKLKLILRERYQHLLEGTAKQGNPVPLNQVYNELYIIEVVNQGLSIQHEVDQIQAACKGLTGDIPINCNDIFKPLPGQDKPIRAVLTRGVAGIGKTVSVQKFILDWAEGKANQQVHFIFPLPFRELNLMTNKNYSLISLLEHFFTKEVDTVLEQIKTHSLIFIFDGLDEYRLHLDIQNNETLCDATKATSVDVLLTNLIKGNLLPSAHIWITSRPASANRIPTECIHRITDVQGFNDPQKEEYFRKRICDQSLVNKVITHLKTLRNLYFMCYIPVFCWIAATVLERIMVDSPSEKMPTSLTQMYTYFLVTQTKTAKTKYSENKGTNKEMIFKLGKLAFEQLERGNLIFYEEDLKKCGIDVKEASVYSGLCTQIFTEESGLFQRKVYSFVHLTIQEHLAALYVFLSLYNNNTNVLDPEQNVLDPPVTLLSLHKCAIDKALESTTGHLDLFLRFLVGFSLESNQVLLQDLLAQNRSLNETQDTIEYLKEKIRTQVCRQTSVKFFHCLSELNDCSLVEEIQAFLSKGDLHERGLSSELWSAVVFVLLTSDDKLDVFELGKYGRTDETLLHLFPVVCFSTNVRLANCNITVKSCVMLAAASSVSSTLKELDLSNNNVQDSGLRLLCAGFNCPLDTMSMDCSVSREKSCNFLHSVIGSKPSSSTEQDSAIQLISKMLQRFFQKYRVHTFTGLSNNCTLEILRMSNCGITTEGCGFLGPVLSSKSSHIRELDLSQNNIGDSGVKELSNTLKKVSCELDTLKLNNCNLSADSCAALGLILSTNSTLKTLSLCHNELRNEGVTLLASGLKNPNCKLEALMMSNCGITTEGCGFLGPVLSSKSSHIRELDLSQNNIGDSGVKELSNTLKKVSCELDTLKLNNCNLSADSCAALGLILSTNSTLKTLSLCHNELRNEGVTLLTSGLKNPNCKLEALMLLNCKVKLGGFQSLISALRSNPSYLRVLDLGRNCPGDLGVKHLLTSLENIQCGLETLKLNECGITDNSIAALTLFLSSESSCLRELDLSVNGLERSREKLISNGLRSPQCKLQL